MACWRVLTLSDLSPSQHVPQLLIKPKFERQTYTVYVTDLSNVWSEELDLDAILERASEQESPIEVSKHDTSQLAILLEHIHKSLTDADDDNSRRMVREDQDGVVLHTSTNLPGPLGSLDWCFHLRKRTSVTLKNELILPLLVSSHIQHERVTGLVASIHEKDKAITKMLDQFESSNLDLASAFPSVGGSRPGRRLVKREQAARKVPALQPFEEDDWLRKTSQLNDGQLSTFSLFQEALSECTSKVPAQLESRNEDDSWWTSLRTEIGPIKRTTPAKAEVKASELPKLPSERSDAETETEDEFETHENFKRREEATAQRKTQTPPTASDAGAPNPDPQDALTEDDEDEDEDDLDAPPRSQSQNHSQRFPLQKAAAKTVTPEPSSQSPKRKGFRIGGARLKAKQTPPESAAGLGNSEDIDVNRNASSPPIEPSEETGSPRKGRRPFKIGGKKDAPGGGATETQATTRAQEHTSTDQAAIDTSKHRDASSSPARPAPIASSPPEEEHEETLEEKAERKRRELKRKNEELAKKQAQKKKKRF